MLGILLDSPVSHTVMQLQYLFLGLYVMVPFDVSCSDGRSADVMQWNESSMLTLVETDGVESVCFSIDYLAVR